MIEKQPLYFIFKKLYIFVMYQFDFCLHAELTLPVCVALQHIGCFVVTVLENALLLLPGRRCFLI